MNNHYRALFLLTSLLSYATVAISGLPFQVTASGQTVTINTTTPNHPYHKVGFSIQSGGFVLNNCTDSMGWCPLGSLISDTSPYSMEISGPSGTLNLLLSLNPTSNVPLTNQLVSIPQRFLYMSGNSAVVVCNINTLIGNNTAGTGLLTNCIDAGGSGFFIPFNVGIILNPAGTFAYIANGSTGVVSGHDVVACAVNTTTGTLSNCNSYSYFNQPNGLTMNATGSRLYVSNYNTKSISMCTITESTGALTNCIQASPAGLNITGIDVILNPTNTLAYLTASDGAPVTLCTVDQNSGLFSNCHPTGPTFVTQDRFTINSAGTYLYVNETDTQTQIRRCVIQANGSLTDCNITGAGFINGISNIELTNNDTLAYTINLSSNTMNLCSVDPITGYLSGCRQILTGLTSELDMTAR